MPLHDWRDDTFWSGVHTSWLTELLRNIKPQLPPEYRAYTATLPHLLVGLRAAAADIKVTRVGAPTYELPGPPPDAPRPAGEPEPDAAGVIATLAPPDRSIVVEHRGLLVAAVEIVSPGNKDAPARRAQYGGKYLGYLRQLVNLMVIDVTPSPRGFSFVNLITEGLALPDPQPVPAPVAASYRVIPGPPQEPCSYELWRRPLAVGQPLPPLPLPIAPHRSVPVDLESTYMRAAADVYLE